MNLSAITEAMTAAGFPPAPAGKLGGWEQPSSLDLHERREAATFCAGLSSSHISNSPDLDSLNLLIPNLRLDDDRLTELTVRYPERVRSKLAFGPEWNFYGITYSQGGSRVRLHAPKSHAPRPLNAARGSITEFSHESRMRLLSFVNGIDRTAVESSRLWFVTLTYPGVWPGDPKEWKKHLNRWRAHALKAWGRLPAIWKLEPQRRGAPHFHLILLVTPEMSRGLKLEREFQDGSVRTRRVWSGGSLAKFRQWCARSWYQAVGSDDTRHLAAGTSVDPVVSFHQASNYAAKYLGKSCELLRAPDPTIPRLPDGVYGPETEDVVFSRPGLGEAVSVGRFWGVWYRDQFPRSSHSESLPSDAFIRLRRVIRKGVLKKQRGRHLSGYPTNSVTCFVSSDVVRRLVSWAFPEREYAAGYTPSGWWKVLHGLAADATCDLASADSPSFADRRGVCYVNN